MGRESPRLARWAGWSIVHVSGGIGHRTGPEGWIMNRLDQERLRDVAWGLRAGRRLFLTAEWSRMQTEDRATVARVLRTTFDGWRADGFMGRLTSDGRTVGRCGVGLDERETPS